MKVIICGAGQVGTTLARHLANEGNNVTVIDIDHHQVSRVDESYDVVTAFGHRERVGRKLVIVGAGNVGLPLAQQIRHVSPNVDIKIIERDQERAKYVSNELGGAVVVLHGDALDQELLEEARVGDRKSTRLNSSHVAISY